MKPPLLSSPRANPRVRGFTLLEALLALFVFSIAVVSLVEAVTRIGQTSFVSRKEQQVQARLDTLLLEASRSPLLLNAGNTLDVEPKTLQDGDVLYTTTVTSLEMVNKEDKALQDIYAVQVKAEWMEGQVPQTVEAETWVYPPLYNSQTR